MAREVGRPHAYIFDAHLLMLDDPLLVERAAEVVRADRVNAEWALRTVSEQLRELFDGLERRVPARAAAPTSTTCRAASC